MGVLESAVGGGLPSTKGLDKILGGIFSRKTDPTALAPDFPAGFRITEIINGVPQVNDTIVLQGNFLPHQPFEFGGEQKIIKDYYPGNSEPVVQVLGARETDMAIKGRFKTKRLKDNGKEWRLVGQEYQQLLDDVRLRGNLLRLELGEWHRYAFMEKTAFKINKLSDIEYEISFSIVGFNQPSNCKFLENPDDDLIRPNKELIAKAATEIADYRNYPDEMPRSLADFLNDQISTVAEAINLVTNFIDGVFTTAQDVEASAARAVGLIKNARTKISVYQRRMGQLNYGLTSMGAKQSVAGLKSAARYNNVAHILKTMAGFLSFSVLLAALQLKYAALIKTTPLRRHLVVEGDSLQKLAVRFYSNQDMWEKIYKHNKLTSTVLARGAVLEIPRL